MKKPPSKKPKRRKGGGLGYFTGGLAAVFLGGALIKSRLDDPPYVDSPPIAMENLCDAFGQQAALNREIAAIDQAIKKIESGDTEEYTLLQFVARDYARTRGYDRITHMSSGQRYTAIPNLSWDLRVLGHYREENGHTFSAEFEKAINEFQTANALPATGQPDTTTLQTLALKAYSQRVLIGLHALKTSLLHTVPLRDLLVIIDAESLGNPYAQARTSSARGLGQILDGTMLEVVARSGATLGYPDLQRAAQRIVRLSEQGKPLPDDLRQNRQSILALRHRIGDSIAVTAIYGKTINGGSFDAANVYARYVLGPGGAQKLMDNPQGRGIDLLPLQARANLSLFYKNKEPKKDKRGRDIKDKSGKPVLEWANPLNGADVLSRIRDRVLSAERNREAELTEVIMRSLLEIPTQAAACQVARDAPRSGKTPPIQVN